MTDHSKQSSRKRSLDDVTESLKESGLSPTAPRPKKMIDIKTLSLEAIFHPKFENENRNQQNIRRDMKEKVKQKEGYIEVSLKHSGNLLLWSGGQRYYSKNSTSNVFTYVGEVLLRQHMERAWWNDGPSPSSTKATIGAVYQECSDYIEANRLTLAFESVTSVLGHHGDLPTEDFLMLTAVADKAAQRFYSTVEILKLAQRFRLPHNDIWVYSTPESVEDLFTVYDTTRETGLADDTNAALDKSANARLSSMYPHGDFQGNILEGLVIRYVSYKSGEREQQEEQLRTLAAAAADILTKVPPCLPPCFDLMSNISNDDSSSKVLCVDIREVFRQCIATGGYTDVNARLGEAICEILNQTDTTRRKVVRQSVKDWDIPKLVKTMLEDYQKSDKKMDEETLRIANLICKVDAQNAAIRYSVLRENDSRWLCTLHILHDKTFMKFQKNMKAGDMYLYRGFSIEMGIKAPSQQNAEADLMEVEESMTNQTSDDDARLMLKMKFLPYMVRTFCCRNGLSIISKSGPASFADYTLKMMKMWGMSKESRAKWQPFFRAWGLYAHECMNHVERGYTNNALPPLNEAFYLNHLEHFIPLYENGTIKGITENGVDGSGYRAMVIVVAIQKENATEVSNYISQELGGVGLRDDINALTDEDFLAMTTGSGLIVSANITEGFGKLRKYVKEYGKDISIILYGCDDETIEASLLPNTKKLKGMTKGWEKTRVGLVKHVVMPSLLGIEDETMERNERPQYGSNDDMKEAIVALKKASASAPDLDKRRGLLVFFPCIPGCGKSALSGPTSQDILKEELKTLHDFNPSSGPQRELVVLVGDKVKAKYWPQVKSTRTKRPACIVITDKNAPSNAWPSVGDAAGNGLVVPVFPDKKALSTTRIEGIRKSSGEVDEQISHFYPFSLHYLAVCMARVMARPAKSHIGGLDRGLQQACLVVTKFFSLYRKLSADELIDSVRARVQDAGSFCAKEPIQVPFFCNKELPELPQDLVEVLTVALQMQYGYEFERKNPEALIARDPAVQNMEERLRATLERHKELLVGITATEALSRDSFVAQVAAFAKAVSKDETMPDAEVDMTKMGAAKNIRLVSLDSPAQTIHAALKAVAKQESGVMEALKFMGAKLDQNTFGSKCFVERTHTTMVHASRMSQAEMRSRFEDLLAQTVDVTVVGLLWSDRIAALTVELPTKTRDGIGMPSSTNEFAHITLWNDGAKSAESNQLPSLVSQGDASEVIFRSPFQVDGTFSFWE